MENLFLLSFAVVRMWKQLIRSDDLLLFLKKQWHLVSRELQL